MIDKRYAGFWIRTAAAIIDTVLLLIVAIPVMTLVFGLDSLKGLETGMPSTGIRDVVFNYLLPAVVVILFWIYRSATPGKMLLKLEIVDAKTGAKPSNLQFIGRYMAYYVSIIPLMLGFVWVAFDKQKQGFHDKLAGTVVIRKGQVESVSVVTPPSVQR